MNHGTNPYSQQNSQQTFPAIPKRPARKAARQLVFGQQPIQTSGTRSLNDLIGTAPSNLTPAPTPSLAPPPIHPPVHLPHRQQTQTVISKEESPPQIQNFNSPAPAISVDTPPPTSTPITPHPSRTQHPSLDLSHPIPIATISRDRYTLWIDGLEEKIEQTIILGNQRFPIITTLMKGGTGEVFLAGKQITDDQGNQTWTTIVFKQIENIRLDEIKEEIRLQIEAYNCQTDATKSSIPRIESLTKLNNNCHLIGMEHIPGKDLYLICEDTESLPCPLKPFIAKLLYSMLNIIIPLHRNNFYHRDIKPENIMLKPDGTLVLIDFGNSLLCKANEPVIGLERFQAGTAGFLSLKHMEELLKGEPNTRENGPVDDLSALGKVMTQLLIGGDLKTSSIIQLQASIKPHQQTSLPQYGTADIEALRLNDLADKAVICTALTFLNRPFPKRNCPELIQLYIAIIRKFDPTLISPDNTKPFGDLSFYHNTPGISSQTTAESLSLSSLQL